MNTYLLGHGKRHYLGRGYSKIARGLIIRHKSRSFQLRNRDISQSGLVGQSPNPILLHFLEIIDIWPEIDPHLDLRLHISSVFPFRCEFSSLTAMDLFKILCVLYRPSSTFLLGAAFNRNTEFIQSSFFAHPRHLTITERCPDSCCI